VIALAGVVAVLLVPQGQGEARLRVIGPQPAVVVYPEPSQVALQIAVKSEAEMRRLTAPKLPQVEGLGLELGQPRTSQQSFFDGRRMTQTFSVSWVIDIRPKRVGDFSIPSFDVPVGNGSESTPALTLRVVKDIEGDRFGFLNVRVEPQRVYVHEPIRVHFDLGIDESVEITEHQASNGERYYGVEIAAPWLSQLEGTVPLDVATPDRRRQINLVYSDGRTQTLLPTQARDRTMRDGHPFQAFAFERAFLPSRPGTLHIPSTAMGFDVFTGETRVVQDFVFNRRERVTKTFYVYAPAVDVEVLPLPEAGRPAPFYGAVGRFTFDARLDRDRVKVGSSVKLIASIRGEGNTEFLQVPELPRDIEGFHLLGSKEKRERGLVEVTYDLTPLRADVRQTPALSWNYFDTTPGVERYVEVTAPALPLHVEALPEGEGLKALPGDETKVMVPGVDDIYDMRPLGVGDPAVVRGAPARGSLLLGLLAPWLLATGLLVWLRARARGRADVAGRRDRTAGKTFRRALDGGKPPFEALVGYLADRLAVPDAAIIGPDLDARLRRRGLDGDLVVGVVQAVEAGVAARYGGAGGVERSQAEALVARLEGARLVPVAKAATVLILLLSLAPSVMAQRDGATANEARGDALGGSAAARGEAAYRAGDYAAAARAFAEAAEAAPVDRRLFYNLGNALYRQGDYARALVAYERAHLGMPRDAELAANLALTRSKLELARGEGEPFLAALGALRDACTPRERVIAAVAMHLLSAFLLVLGWRRVLLRTLGFLVLGPALLLTVELLVLAPARPPRGILVAERGAVTAEPRSGLEPVVKLRRGASVDVLGEGPTWVKVRAGEREGYLPADAVAVIR